MQTTSPANAADEIACASAGRPVRERIAAATIGMTRQTMATASRWDGAPRQRRYGASPAEREGACRQPGRDEALMPGPFGRIAMRGFVNEPGEPEFNR